MWLTKVLRGDATRLDKFKVRIEDPPRRKNMVFIGGAVWPISWPTKITCGSQNKSGKSKDLEFCKSWGLDKK